MPDNCPAQGMLDMMKEQQSKLFELDRQRESEIKCNEKNLALVNHELRNFKENFSKLHQDFLDLKKTTATKEDIEEVKATVASNSEINRLFQQEVKQSLDAMEKCLKNHKSGFDWTSIFEPKKMVFIGICLLSLATIAVAVVAPEHVGEFFKLIKGK